MKIYSPSNIEVLIHCHCTPAPHPRLDAPAVADAIQMFLKMDCIEENGKDQYITTARGRAWVAALCNVEAPTAAFVDEQGRIL